MKLYLREIIPYIDITIDTDIKQSTLSFEVPTQFPEVVNVLGKTLDETFSVSFYLHETLTLDIRL